MTKDFSDQIEVRKDPWGPLEGFDTWHWVKGETGAYGTDRNGPREDWRVSHSKKYFNHIKKYDTIVTAGACCGMYVKFYAQKFKTVYAFEPNVRNFQCMVLNNPYNNVIKINAALGAGHKMIATTENNSNVGALQVKDTGPIEKRIIPTLMLDDFDFHELDVIQLDVEGQEQTVLEGARKTIEKHHPVIIVERQKATPILESLNYEMVEKSMADHIYLWKG